MKLADINALIEWFGKQENTRDTRGRFRDAIRSLFPWYSHAAYWYNYYTLKDLSIYTYIEILKIHGWL